MKKSFLLYSDIYENIKTLSREEKGDLLDAIFIYADKKTIPKLSPVISMAFSFIKQGIDRDTQKYNEKCEKYKQNVLIRWKKNKYDRKPSNTMVFNGIPIDSDNDPVPVPVPDILKNNNNPTEEKYSKPLPCSKEDLLNIASKLNIPIKDVEYVQGLLDADINIGKVKPKNYNKTLLNWCKNQIEWGKIIPTDPLSKLPIREGWHNASAEGNL